MSAQSHTEIKKFQALSARQQKFEAKGGIGRNGPLFHYVAREQLDVLLRQQFEAGDKQAILQALSLCAIHDLVMPQWLAEAYLRAYRAVQFYNARSWEGVFGVPSPKNERAFRAARDKHNRRYEVWIAVNEAEKRGRQRNNALFEEIGKKVNPPIGRGLAREYFDSVERRMGRKSSKPTHASIGDHPLLHRPIRRK